MPLIEPLRNDLEEYLHLHKLEKKWIKIKKLFEQNLRHPSLHVELLEPRHLNIYSMRIDQKYRALFIVHKDACVEVFQITNHYR